MEKYPIGSVITDGIYAGVVEYSCQRDRRPAYVVRDLKGRQDTIFHKDARWVLREDSAKISYAHTNAIRASHHLYDDLLACADEDAVLLETVRAFRHIRRLVKALGKLSNQPPDAYRAIAPAYLFLPLDEQEWALSHVAHWLDYEDPDMDDDIDHAQET